MADEKPAAKKGGVVKAGMGGLLGLLAGGVGVWATTVVNQVAKPAMPVANFAVSADGLTVTCQNHASGDSGWWDFGDGTPLEPFDAKQEVVKHTFAKTGNYNVKLTVRNYFADENERSVPVDLTQPAATASAGGPTVTNFTATPVGGITAAPATFRVKGQVANADKVFWDTGSEMLEVTDSPGAFEKLVVFEKPDTYRIQVIGYNGRTAVKKAATVVVSAPQSGNLSVTVRVSGTATKVERRAFADTVAIPVPTKDGKTLERVVAARPGFVITEAKLGAVTSAAAKNLKVAVAADKKSATLTGEWTGSGNAATKSAGGSDLMVPLILTQERITNVTVPNEAVAAHFATDAWLFGGDSGSRAALLTMPPLPAGVTNAQMKYALEIQETRADGVPVAIGALADLKLPYAARVRNASGVEQVLELTQQPNGQIKATLRPSQAQPRAGR